MVVIKRVYIYA